MCSIFKWINSKLSNAKTLPRYFPIVLKSGKGMYVTDINNNVYIDCISAAGALPFGHNHKIMKKSMSEFMEGDYTSQTMDIPSKLQYDFMNTLY